MLRNGRALRVALSMAAILLPSTSRAQWPPAPRDDWNAEIVFTAALHTAEGAMQLQPSGTGTVNASFGESVGALDPGGSIRVETKTKLSALMAGVAFLHHEEQGEVDTESGTASGELTISQWILDAGATYRFASDFEILAAARYYVLGIDAQFGSAGIGDDRSWMDVYLGGRITTASGRWTFSIRGDIGSGGSNLAWFGNGVLAYRMGGKTAIRAEYRILNLDRGDVAANNHLGWDVVQNGLGLGIGFGL